MFYADIGGSHLQCVDHINLSATSNPRSLHYRGPRTSGSAPGSNAGSRGGSRAHSYTGQAPSTLVGAVRLGLDGQNDSEGGCGGDGNDSDISESAKCTKRQSNSGLNSMRVSSSSGCKAALGPQQWSGQLHRLQQQQRCSVGGNAPAATDGGDSSDLLMLPTVRPRCRAPSPAQAAGVASQSADSAVPRRGSPAWDGSSVVIGFARSVDVSELRTLSGTPPRPMTRGPLPHRTSYSSGLGATILDGVPPAGSQRAPSPSLGRPPTGSGGGSRSGSPLVPTSRGPSPYRPLGLFRGPSPLRSSSPALDKPDSPYT